MKDTITVTLPVEEAKALVLRADGGQTFVRMKRYRWHLREGAAKLRTALGNGMAAEIRDIQRQGDEFDRLAERSR